MHLDMFNSSNFERGASVFKQAIWFSLNGVLLSSWLPGSSWRRALLRAFGAKIGKGVILKPGIRVKFPWRLSIGDFSWIGEQVFVDNLGYVSIGSHACVSQGAFLCTGSHDWTSNSFDLIVRPITVCDHAWVGAMSLLAPGAILGEGAVLSLGGVGKGELAPWTIYSGNPAKILSPRSTTEIEGF